MYRLLFALIVSLFVSSVYGASQIVGKYDNETSIYQEFNNVFNHVQDKEFTVVNSSPSGKSGQVIFYSTGTYCAICFELKTSTMPFCFELKPLRR